MSYNIPHIKKRAIKIFDDYKKYLNNDIRQAIAWRFPKSKGFPEGIKYRFAFIHKRKCILRYDNERTKGHHKHISNKKIKIKFTDIDNLYIQYIWEIKQLRKKLLEKKNETQRN